MKNYTPPKSENWKGRISEDRQYLHEKIECVDLLSNTKSVTSKGFAILGYACDEGVKRNKGKVGAIKGPDCIKQTLGSMPNPLSTNTSLYDFGNVSCLDNHLKIAQENLVTSVSAILNQNLFPIVIGGGHDIAYGHYNGIKKHLGNNKRIGIINFDAHFDLRSDEDTSMTALNARNAKASSDHVVTISEQGQALSQRKQKKADEVKTNKYNKLLEELEEEFIEGDLPLLSHSSNKDIKENYEEKKPTGDYLDQIV